MNWWHWHISHNKLFLIEILNLSNNLKLNKESWIKSAFSGHHFLLQFYIYIYFHDLCSFLERRIWESEISWVKQHCSTMSKLSLMFCSLLGLLVLCHAGENNKIGFYELKKGNMRLNLTNYGASIISVFVPDKSGLFYFLSFLNLKCIYVYSLLHDIYVIFFYRQISWCCSWLWFHWVLWGMIIDRFILLLFNLQIESENK
jgi:hypothetical protein